MNSISRCTRECLITGIFGVPLCLTMFMPLGVGKTEIRTSWTCNSNIYEYINLSYTVIYIYLSNVYIPTIICDCIYKDVYIYIYIHIRYPLKVKLSPCKNGYWGKTTFLLGTGHLLRGKLAVIRVWGGWRWIFHKNFVYQTLFVLGS